MAICIVAAIIGIFIALPFIMGAAVIIFCILLVYVLIRDGPENKN